MANISDIYDSKQAGLRGKAKEGCVRPTVKQFFTSNPFWSCEQKFAAGGEIHTWNDGVDDYRIHVFRSSGTFIRQGLTVADVAVIAGGGGAGNGSGTYQYGNPLTTYYYGGAGGGAGGVLDMPDLTLPEDDEINIIVGLGGLGGTSGRRGANGGDSYFGTYMATGGGGGAGSSSSYREGNAGGSGGGSIDRSTGAAGIAGQGNRGGGSDTFNQVLRYWPGGGGGASGVGGKASGVTYVGAGGAGVSGSWLNDIRVAAGLPQFMARGGGGANLRTFYHGTNGADNSGSGASGASSHASSQNKSPRGGSGVVVIRYKI